MSPCSFFFFVLFSFFTSEIKTDMECHTCFIVYFRSVCVDSGLIELMLFNLGPYAKSLLFVYSSYGTFEDPLHVRPL